MKLIIKFESCKSKLVQIQLVLEREALKVLTCLLLVYGGSWECVERLRDIGQFFM